MATHGRPPVLGRRPGTDLFDDPPWPAPPDVGRSPLAWIRHLGFVLLLVVLSLLGLLLVVVLASLVGFWRNFHLSLGPIDISPTPPSSYGIDIALSPDGSKAYLTEPTDNRLLVLNSWTGRTLATVPVGDDPTGLALTPDGSEVWVVNTTLSSSATGSSSVTGPPLGTGTGSVSVVSTATNEVLGTVPVGSGPIDVAFSPDGRTAYVTNNGVLSPGSVSVIDTATLTVVATLTPTPAPNPSLAGSLGPNPTSVAVTPNGAEVWVSEVNDADELGGSSTTPDDVTVFNTLTGAQMAQIPVGTGPFFMAISPDGGDAYVADKLSCDVREIDTATFAVVATVDWPSSHGCPYGLALGPNDNLVYTVTGSDHTFGEGHSGNAFGSVDFATGRADVLGAIGRDPVTMALSPGATTAYVVDADRPVIDLVDPTDGARKATFAIPF
jgi:YVTN family beta-propeller protein